MSKMHNIFISWSGERSQWIAEALRDWLPTIVQAAKPWMSATDIEKGSRGLHEVSRALEGIKAGVICLTPENLDGPWILYEAGALSKTIDDKTCLSAYLLAGLQFQDVKPPLGMFQATKADKEDTRKLIHAINRVVSDEPVPEANLNRLFDALWSELEQKLKTMPEPKEVVETKRTIEDMVAEMLEITRAEANRRKQADWIDQYVPQLQEVFPLLSEALKAAKKPTPMLGKIQSQPSPEQVETRKLFHVKLQYEDDIKEVEGTLAEEEFPGRVIIYDRSRVVARFDNGVERWWTDSPKETIESVRDEVAE